MSFFDSKQEVIDIELTLFGRGLLARGFFKPVYYRFFDDDILYNFPEQQNTTEERILQTPRSKTQYLTVPVEQRFEHNQNLINMGQAKTFMEIRRRQDPLIIDTVLRYPLENCNINSPEAPRFHISIGGPKITKGSESITAKGVELPIIQLNLTSSYVVYKDKRKMKSNNLPTSLVDSETYIDLSKDKIDFLDDTCVYLEREDLVIDLQEIGIELGLDNFEIEIYEVIDGTAGENKKIVRLEKDEDVKKFFDIQVDTQVQGPATKSLTGKSSPRGRKT